ncbi:heavy-metal-associated domain-containing protein [Flagellimonas lutimaris]|uniref:Heavy-metal-associated domain-containing protein n=1 Tax=Flagellimonas lutimaris TaxID=475082 RepID=A0A3A1NAW4_9FLAO|nr:heavy metal-associated domain-containing protein [Allomuricauda lutimaris]RIV36704.1 heavy-metal-associated domain-containing protein [Allomuricauda lutimaris]
MEHKEFQFKTNLNCGGCVSKVKSDLDNQEGIVQWHVDTDNANKILTVKSKGITKDEIADIVKQKGFQIETLVA